MLSLMLLLCVMCNAVPVEESPRNAKILVYHSGVPTANTVFDYYYVTENGIKQDVTGRLDEGVAVMKGKYEYTGTDNNLYRVAWYADETGYHPAGEHLYRLDN